MKQRNLPSDLLTRGLAVTKPLVLDQESFETSVVGMAEKGVSPLPIFKGKVVVTLKAEREKTLSS